MSDQPPTARVVLRYAFDRKGTFRAKVLAVDLLDVPPPLDGEEIPESGVDGAWLDVMAPQGALAFRVPVPAPDLGLEVVGPDGDIRRRSADAGESRTLAVEIPWFGPGTRIVLRQADGSDLATRSVPGLASIPLEPTAPTRAARGEDAVPLTIWGHDNPRAIVLLFLAEAFREEEAAAFEQAVDTCVGVLGETLRTLSATRDLKRAFAPFRLMLNSKESGIAPTKRKTALGAHWQSGTADERLILIDEAKAAKHRSALGGRRSVQTIAIVNTQRYGGSGGATAVTSRDPAAMGQVLVHELGHSLFALGDEYVDERLVRRMGEPVAANVSGPFDPPPIKWAALVSPGATLPTPETAPMPAVGAYEGAFYAAKHRYRPSFNCKMREATAEFCPVCADAIARRLSPHL